MRLPYVKLNERPRAPLDSPWFDAWLAARTWRRALYWKAIAYQGRGTLQEGDGAEPGRPPAGSTPTTLARR